MCVCLPPKFICWNPNPQYDGLRRWRLWEVIVMGGRTFVNGNNTLIKE